MGLSGPTTRIYYNYADLFSSIRTLLPRTLFKMGDHSALCISLQLRDTNTRLHSDQRLVRGARGQVLKDLRLLAYFRAESLRHRASDAIGDVGTYPPTEES